MKRSVSIILSLLMMFSLTLTGCAAGEATEHTSGNIEITAGFRGTSSTADAQIQNWLNNNGFLNNNKEESK